MWTFFEPARIYLEMQVISLTDSLYTITFPFLSTHMPSKFSWYGQDIYPLEPHKRDKHILIVKYKHYLKTLDSIESSVPSFCTFLKRLQEEFPTILIQSACIYQYDNVDQMPGKRYEIQVPKSS